MGLASFAQLGSFATEKTHGARFGGDMACSRLSIAPGRASRTRDIARPLGMAAPSDIETIPRTMITLVSILLSYLGLGPSLSLRHPSKPLGFKAVCEVFVRFQEQLELVRVNNQVF